MVQARDNNLTTIILVLIAVAALWFLFTQGDVVSTTEDTITRTTIIAPYGSVEREVSPGAYEASQRTDAELNARQQRVQEEQRADLPIDPRLSQGTGD